MKQIWRKIKIAFAWLTSRRVLDAINAGLPYDEVERIAREEAGG